MKKVFFVCVALLALITTNAQTFVGFDGYTVKDEVITEQEWKVATSYRSEYNCYRDTSDWFKNKEAEVAVFRTLADWEKESYVFDPVEGIRIGRGPQNNNVIIPDDEVSLHHCVLYQASSDLVLEDLHSTNGTVLMHGLNKRRIRGRVRIFDGDRICVGSTEMTVHVFWIDSAYI